MEISEFFGKARELTETLERFGVAFARYTAVTCLAGDGICIDFDRSDRFAASLHRKMLKAFEGDRFVISYDPLNIVYESLPAADEGTLSNSDSIGKAAEGFKNMLFDNIGESYYSDSANAVYHVIFTSDHGVCISASDFDSLERSVFRTEEYVGMMKKRALKEREIISKAGDRTAEAVRRHRILADGSEYIKKRR